MVCLALATELRQPARNGASAGMFNNNSKWNQSLGKLIFPSSTAYAANEDIILVVSLLQPLLANAAVSAVSTDWQSGHLLSSPFLVVY